MMSNIIDYKGCCTNTKVFFSKSKKEHTTDTGTTKNRIPQGKRKPAEKEIQEMADNGIIEPVSGHWCSPIVMVEKTDKSVRFSLTIEN